MTLSWMLAIQEALASCCPASYNFCIIAGQRRFGSNEETRCETLRDVVEACPSDKSPVQFKQRKRPIVVNQLEECADRDRDS
jgi:hypothetical protein